MGNWYRVTKKIHGRFYDYWQRTYRVGKQVKTENKYLGPTGRSSTPSSGIRSSHIPWSTRQLQQLRTEASTNGGIKSIGEGAGGFYRVTFNTTGDILQLSRIHLADHGITSLERLQKFYSQNITTLLSKRAEGPSAPATHVTPSPVTTTKPALSSPTYSPTAPRTPEDVMRMYFQPKKSQQPPRPKAPREPRPKPFITKKVAKKYGRFGKIVYIARRN
jgi:hypothetical protein